MPSPDVVLVAPYPTAGQRHAGPSGVASYSANLAHALSGRGASVEVIAPEEPDAPDEPEISRDGSIVVRRAFRRGPWAMPAASSEARRVGKECARPCHSRWSPSPTTKKKTL